MASLPPFQQFLPEDYKGAPSWFSAFLGNLNQYTLAIYAALNGSLTVTQNLDEARFTLNVVGGTTSTNFTGNRSFKNTLASQISDLWITKVVINGNPVYTPNTTAIGPIDWTASTSTIAINSIPGLTSTVSYSITVRYAV